MFKTFYRDLAWGEWETVSLGALKWTWVLLRLHRDYFCFLFETVNTIYILFSVAFLDVDTF